MFNHDPDPRSGSLAAADRSARRGLLGALLLVLCGCGMDPAEDAGVRRLSDFVAFQNHQLTTDLISTADGFGQAALSHGWQDPEATEENQPWVMVADKAGQLQVFAADGDLVEIELEMARGDVGEPRRLAVHILLNDERLDRVILEPAWQSFSVKVPPQIVRRGVNTLEIRPRYGKRPVARTGGTQARLRRVRARSGSGRSLWPARPQAIAVDDGIVLPVAGFFDAVLEIPQDARLAGSYAVTLADRPSPGAWAYIQLLDDSGQEWTLLNRRLLKSRDRRREVDLDLSRWAGQTVRLRIGTTGPGNGVLHWYDLRVTSASAIAAPSLPPIARTDVARSGRLGRPDVFVILLDAARADAFSPFGGPYPTPAAGRLADDGTVFAQALAPSSWTGQSVPGMLTGLYPDSLRVGPIGSVMPAEVTSLPELLTAAGYRSVLWSQHPLYRNHESFQRGFEQTHTTDRGAYEDLPTAEFLTDEQRPTFAWIHLIPPHAPYRPPPPFRGRYSAGYRGAVSAEDVFLSRFPQAADPDSLSSEDLEYLRGRYLENVAFADSLVARLLAELESVGRYGDSLIVLLSDHGEAFLEHGSFLHTRNLHTELLHVPLIVKWPAGKGEFAARIEQTVSLVDLVPTLADGLGLAGASDGFQGRSWLPAAFDGTAAERALYAVTRGVDDRRKAPWPSMMMQAGAWRLLYEPLRDVSRLYDTAADPLETRNLIGTHTLEALRLRQAVLSQAHANKRLLGESGSEVVEELDPEAVEQLQALGYLN